MAAVESRRRAPFPVATVFFAVVTAAGAVAQLRDPEVLALLRRNYPALHHGQWWRWLSPLAVQSAGWGQILFNLGSLVVVGVIAERRFGTVRWVLLYLGVGLLGEVLGERLDPTGAGNSLAVCGLVGGLLTLLLLSPGAATRPQIFVVPYYVSCVAGLGYGGIVGAIVVPTVALVLLSWLLRVDRIGSAAVLAGLAALAGAAALAIRPDQHGIAILIGAFAGLLFWPPATAPTVRRARPDRYGTPVGRRDGA